MDELHARAKDVFLRACELTGTAREDFLEREFSSDVALRKAVLEMLENDADPPEFLRVADSGGSVRSLAREIAELDECALPLPDRIGSYRILRLLGRGEMRAVFEAEQENPRRRVAIKILAGGSGSRGRLRRLRQEAQILARLRHPGIAQVHEAGSSEVHGVVQPWFAMELVEGATLIEHARRARLDVRARVALVAEVCDAVQHAHEAGVLHCDLKDSNVIVGVDGRPKVIDFGVARLVGSIDGSDRTATATGELFGTLATMSPEHVARGPRDLDARSDVWSLGVIAYELLAGRPPIDVSGLSVPEAARRICEDPATRAGALNHELAGDLETVLETALAKDRVHRYASARQLADDLRRWSRGEPIAARPPSVAYRLRLYARRNRALSAVAAVAALSLAGFVGFAAWSAVRERGLRDLAAQAEVRDRVLSARRALRGANPRLARELLAASTARSAAFEWRRLDRELHGWICELPDAGLLVDAGFDGAGGAFALARDGSHALFDATSGTVIRRRSGGPGRASAVAAGPGGAICASFDDDVLVLWSAADDAELQRLPLAPGASDDPRGAACFAPSGRWIAARGRVYDLTDPLAPARPVGSGFAAFSRDPELLAVQDRGVTVIDPLHGGTVHAIDPGFVPLALALDPAARSLAVSDARSVHLWDLAQRSGRVLPALHVHPVNALAFRPDGARLAVMEDDGSFLVHDPRVDRVVLQGFGTGSSWKSSLAWSPDGALLLTASWARRAVRVWDAREEPEVLRGHERYVYPVAYAAGGERIVSGGWDRAVRVWCAATNETIAVLAGHGGQRVQDLATSPQGDAVVSAGDDGALIVWDLGTGAQRARTADAEPWGAVAWSPRGAIAAAHEKADRAPAFRRPADLSVTGPALAPAGGVLSLAFSPDGALLAAGRSSGELAIWDAAAGGEARLARLGGPVRDVAFSPDGRSVVTASDDGFVRVVDVATMLVRFELRGHAREVFAACWSPDGSRIASAGRDRLVRLWDAERGEEVGVLEGHLDYVWSAAFHPGGGRIATGSGDGTVRQWESEPAGETYARRARRLAARPEARARVDGLLESAGSAAGALAELERLPDLDPDARQAARDELLRRSLRENQDR